MINIQNRIFHWRLLWCTETMEFHVFQKCRDAGIDGLGHTDVSTIITIDQLACKVYGNIETSRGWEFRSSPVRSIRQ